MNLASLLNLTVTPPTTATPLQATGAVESPVLPEFAALLGLAAAPAPSANVLPDHGEAPATTGKMLPDAAIGLPEIAADLTLADPAPVLPEMPPVLAAMLTLVPDQISPAQPAISVPEEPTRAAAAPMPPVIAPATPSPMLPQMLPATLPAAPQMLPPATSSKDTGETPAQSAGPQQSAPVPTPAPAARQPLQVQFDVRPPLPVAALPIQPAAAQVAAEAPPAAAVQQVVQQFVQGTEQRRHDAQRFTATAAVLPNPEKAAASPAPVTPVVVPAIVAPLLADAPRPAAGADPQALQSSAATAPAGRHDFEAIVDRLSEARELALPGRASLQLAHREFGPVSVQFDMAGQSLKVALASADAAFAPAVQAALAERPVMAPGDASAMRSDTRSDQQAAAAATTAATSGPAAQGEGQRHEHNSRGAQSRPTADQVQRQPYETGDSDAPTSRRGRDGSLFA